MLRAPLSEVFRGRGPRFEALVVVVAPSSSFPATLSTFIFFSSFLPAFHWWQMFIYILVEHENLMLSYEILMHAWVGFSLPLFCLFPWISPFLLPTSYIRGVTSFTFRLPCDSWDSWSRLSFRLQLWYFLTAASLEAFAVAHSASAAGHTFLNGQSLRTDDDTRWACFPAVFLQSTTARLLVNEVKENAGRLVMDWVTVLFTTTTFSGRP